MKNVAVLVVVILIAYVFVLAVSELPPYGAADNPGSNEVTDWYNKRCVEETGAVNVVAGIILDYRAYDTTIEATVLFTAIISIVLTLKIVRKSV